MGVGRRPSDSGFEMVGDGMAKVVGMQFTRSTGGSIGVPGHAAHGARWRSSSDLRLPGHRRHGRVSRACCFRRTTLLGACLIAAALIDVVLVNFFYDVPVKLFASLYLTMDLL